MPSRKQGITGLSQRQRTFSESGVNGVALMRLGKPWRHGGPLSLAPLSGRHMLRRGTGNDQVS